MMLLTSMPVKISSSTANTRPSPGMWTPNSVSGRTDAGSSSSVWSIRSRMKRTTSTVTRIGTHTSNPAIT